jgi:hypothetical protein
VESTTTRANLILAEGGINQGSKMERWKHLLKILKNNLPMAAELIPTPKNQIKLKNEVLEKENKRQTQMHNLSKIQNKLLYDKGKLGLSFNKRF